MRKSIEHLKKNTSIYVPIFITLACVLFLPIFYYEVDDRFLQDIVMSASYNEHSDFLFLIAGPWGFALRFLTLLIPAINWLAVLYCTAITLSFISFYAFVKKMVREEIPGIYYFLFGLLQFLVMFHFTFTVVAFVSYAGSVAFSLRHARTKKDYLYLIPTFLLFVLSWMLRPHMGIVYVIIAFFLAMSVYLLYKKRVGIFHVLLILLLIFGATKCVIKIQLLHAESVQMIETRKFHNARANIIDTAWFTYEEAEEVLFEKGISENDLQMVWQFMIGDKSVFDQKKLQDMGLGQTIENKYNFDILGIAKEMASNLYFEVFTILFVVLLLQSPKRWFWFLVFYGGGGASVAYLYLFNRPEPRVIFPSLIVAAVFMILCLAENHEAWIKDKLCKTQKHKKYVKTGGILLFVALVGILSLVQYRKLYIEYHALESRHEIFDYAKENPDKYITATSWTRNWLYSKRVHMLTRNVEDHVIHNPYGDWYLYFPYYYARMEKLGLGEYSEKAMLLPIEHPDCYFLVLDSIEIPLLTTYYKEHYDIDVEAEEIESFNEDRFKLYKLHIIE